MCKATSPEKFSAVYLGLKKQYVSVIASATDFNFGRYFLGRLTGFVFNNHERSWINGYFNCISWVKKSLKSVFCRPINTLDRKF